MIALIRVAKMIICALLLVLGVHLVNVGEEWNIPKIRSVILTDVYEYVDGDNNIKARGKFKDTGLKTTFTYPITHKLYTEFQVSGYKDEPMEVALSRKDVGDPSYPKMQTEIIPNFIFIFAGGYFIWEGIMLFLYRNQPRKVLDEI